MQSLVENARRIFEVAEAATDREPQDFALLIRPDGALHFLMESQFSIEGASDHAGAACAFRVTRDAGGVRVSGQRAGFTGTERCLIEKRSTRSELLRDQPLYRISDPPLLSAAAG